MSGEPGALVWGEVDFFAMLDFQLQKTEQTVFVATKHIRESEGSERLNPIQLNLPFLLGQSRLQ